MNLKALVTTLVLGSSTMASAGTLTLSGKVSVSLSTSSKAPAPIVRDHRAPTPAYQAPAPIVRDHAADPCATPAPAPVYQAPVYQAPLHRIVYQPVWSGPFYRPHNTTVGTTASVYTGWTANSNVRLVHSPYSSFITGTNTGWFDLTEATRIDSGREFFKIGADNGLFRQLKLENLGTRGSNIKQVGIEFVDGLGTKKTQVVKLDRTLDARHPSITIDLDGNYRAIGRIIVYGSTNQGAAYKILAM